MHVNLTPCFCICVCSEMDNPEARVTEIHALVHRLPEKNRQMLELLMKHLAKYVEVTHTCRDVRLQ